MTAQELQQKIYETMEALDRLVLPQPDVSGEIPTIGEYAKRRANKEFLEEKKKFVLAQEMENATGSAAAREATALASDEYINHLWSMTTAKGLSLQTEAEKTLLEKKLDSYRSLLSFEKDMINKGK